MARIFEPGHKFDFMPVLWGAQGIRKSTFIKTLALGFFGELTASFKEEQKLMEQMRGCWIMEVAELVSMTNSEVEHAKQFISQTKNQVRMAYGHHESTFDRQTVFMGSTNNPDFLKDDTGNRRFWPIEVLTGVIDIDRLVRNLPQIWAEAVQMYRDMRAEYPHGDLPLFLAGDEANRTAAELQEEALRPSAAAILAERIQPFLDGAPEVNEHFNEVDPDTPRHHEFVSPAWLLDKLNDPKVTTQALSAALNRCGWKKSGKRARVQGHRNPVAVYYPSEEVLARWELEDDLDDLI